MGFARCEFLFSEVLCPETESDLKSQFKSWGPGKWSEFVFGAVCVSHFFQNSPEQSIS